MLNLSKEDIQKILVKGLVDQMFDRSEERIDECEAVGLVIEIEPLQKTYVFRYIIDTQEYGLQEIKYQSLENNSLVYYHEDESAIATYAAIHGDGIVLEEDMLLSVQTEEQD